MKYLFLIGWLFAYSHASAQFHNLTMPQASPATSTELQLGVTKIRIDYHSPSVRGRDVWNNPNVIPQGGQPLAWRAGANENTTIQFDTDVIIEGKPLKAGSYGFHIIPNGHEHTLLFAKPDNLWGSYYLNVDTDVVQKVTVSDSATHFYEHLSYSFFSRTENSVTVGLHWADRVIPFNISVDLEKTTIEKFRYELNGENTYRWEAWNDAALWCLRHNTNLEEALQWVNRSINGGYGGFAAHKSFVNMSTKIKLLHALGKETELEATIAEVFTLDFTVDDAHYMGATFIELKRDKEALKLLQKGLKRYENDWGMLLYSSVAQYYLGQNKKATKALDTCAKHCPEWFMGRIEEIKKVMAENKYEFPNRKG